MIKVLDPNLIALIILTAIFIASLISVRFVTDEKFDLLIIGFMGHSRVFGRVMGITAQNIIRLSPCTTLVVKVPLR